MHVVLQHLELCYPQNTELRKFQSTMGAQLNTGLSQYGIDATSSWLTGLCSAAGILQLVALSTYCTSNVSEAFFFIPRLRNVITTDASLLIWLCFGKEWFQTAESPSIYSVVAPSSFLAGCIYVGKIFSLVFYLVLLANGSVQLSGGIVGSERQHSRSMRHR